MNRGMTRKTCSSAYSTGMKCIERDFTKRYGGMKLPVTGLNEIRRYDIAFLSLTSVQEVESFIIATKSPEYRKNKTLIIAGGAGMINIYPIIDYIDIAVFGRCDNSQILDIVDGKYDANVWVKTNDPKCRNKYEIGDFKEPKHNFETGTIGCRMKCAYCHYTHVRKHDNQPYSPERGAAETDIWASDFTRPRVYVTAIDGLSEETRYRVNKKISDEFLVEKVSEFYSQNNRSKTVGIKFYNIVGYPWETIKSVKKDYEDTVNLLSKIDRKTGKWNCKINLQNTPFSPEPLTPMEKVDVDFSLNFKPCFNKKYKGIDVSVSSTPFFQGPATRGKRVAINRCTYDNREIVRSFIMGEVSLQDIKKHLSSNDIVPYLIRPVPYTTSTFSEWEQHDEL